MSLRGQLSDYTDLGLTVRKPWLSVLAATVLLTGGVAHAGLMSSTVNVSAAVTPTTPPFVVDPGNRMVSDAVEYPAGSFVRYNDSIAVDITDSQFILSIFPTNFQDATFNGFILRVVSGPDILDAMINSASAFQPVDLEIRDGNRLLLNYQGVDLPSSSTRLMSIIDITTGNAVPEPASSLLLGIGILALLVGSRASAGLTSRPRAHPIT
jgi:hypothetical protein